MRPLLLPGVQRQIRHADHEEGYGDGRKALPQEIGQQPPRGIEEPHQENLLLQPPRKLQVLHRPLQGRTGPRQGAAAFPEEDGDRAGDRGGQQVHLPPQRPVQDEDQNAPEHQGGARRPSQTRSRLIYLTFTERIPLSVLVQPPQSCLHLLGDVIVTASLADLFLQSVIHPIPEVLLLGIVICLVLIPVCWFYWFWVFGHLVCLIRLCSRHLHITCFGWRGSLKFGVITFLRLLIALNGLVDIGLVILHSVYFSPIFRLRVAFNLIKLDDCGLVLRWFMLLEGRVIDLVVVALLLKILHFLIAQEM